MLLTLDHFERWLEGQIAFGIELCTDTRFSECYLQQHPADYVDPALNALFTRYPCCTARDLQDAIQKRKAKTA